MHNDTRKLALELFLRRGIHIDTMNVEQKAEPKPERVENSEHHSTPYYIWRTRGDNRVRSRHAERNGKIFSWDDPPEGGHPGEDYNCRCWAEPYHGPATDGIQDLNPQIIGIVSSLAVTVPRLAAVWLAWAVRSAATKNWVLGYKKTPKQWANRLRDREWTPEQITETIKKGKRFEAENRIRPENTATRYEWNNRYVVVDDVTNEVMQISRPDFLN